MEDYSGGICVFFTRLGVGNDWAEYFSKVAVRLSLATHNSIEYFKKLTLTDLMRTARQIADVLHEKEDNRWLRERNMH